MKQVYLLKDYSKNNKISIKKNINDQHRTLHYHDCIEMFILTEGTGIHCLNGVETPLNTNDIILINQNDSHAIYNMSTINVIYNLMFHPSLLNETNKIKIKDSLFHKHISASENEVKIIVSLFDSLSFIMESKLYFSNEICSDIINAIVSIYFNLNDSLSEFRIDSASTIQNAFQRALSFINLHYKEDISLEDVAKEAFISPSYLSQSFKKKINLTFKEYLNQTRIANAKQLLKTTDKSITSICYESGFSSIATFIRVFNSLEKISPSGYRKKLTQEVKYHRLSRWLD